MPCPDQRLLFVASDQEDEQQADQEIVQWAAVHGYREPQADHVYSIYRNRGRDRDWRLLERRPA